MKTDHPSIAVQSLRKVYGRGNTEVIALRDANFELRQGEIDALPGLTTLLASHEVGPCLIEDAAHRGLIILNHLEYDSGTLKEEYDRDIAAGRAIAVPVNYYPGDDPARLPTNRWRSHAHLLYGNWINEIYQSTPYDQAKIGGR